MHRIACGERAPQRGIASMMTIVAVGLSLTASVLATAYYLRGRQAQTVTVHAQTQAQLNAWAGAEVLRAYLDKLQANNLITDFLAMTASAAQPVSLQLSGDALANRVKVDITNLSPQATPPTVTARIVGTTAVGTRAHASALLEVVYAVELQSSCTEGMPVATLTSRGGVAITGGPSGVVGSTGLAVDIAADGGIAISNASTAKISGCAKQDINISGGGVANGGKLYSEKGTIVLKQMQLPVGVDLWAKDITIESSTSLPDDQSIKDVRAGAYEVQVVDAAGVVIGQAYVGGKTLPAVGGVVHVLPPADAKVAVSLNGVERWLLDLSRVTIHATTGALSGADTASEAIASGAGKLPAVVYLRSPTVWGGKVAIQAKLRANTVWGNTVSFSAWNGNYAQVKALGKISAINPTINELLGSADLIATNMTLNGATGYTNGPLITSGRIAGKLKYGGSETVVTNPDVMPTLLRDQSQINTGLPGVPYCDTRAPEVRIAPYESQANYVFKYDGNVPKLTVRNVKRRDAKNINGTIVPAGASMDGIYPLDGTSDIVNELMSCGWTNTGACSFPTHSTPPSQWAFVGMKRFPVGTLWFDRGVSLTPDFPSMAGTLLAMGGVELGNGTDTNNKIFKAPSHAGVPAMCDGSFYPTDLCASLRAGKTPALGNMAIMTEQNVVSNGWKIYGNLQLGGQLVGQSSQTNVYGTAGVGLNNYQITQEPVDFGSGGVMINVSGLGSSQLVQPGGPVCVAGSGGGTGGASGTTSGSAAGEGSTRMLWSRYL